MAAPVSDDPSRSVGRLPADSLRLVQARRDGLLDDARPEATARRHDAGRWTARQSIDALLDPGSFVEYGGLAVAAQRSRRDHDWLVARTPADGLVGGVGTVDGRPVAVASYDYTVLAGTQGARNHAKKDRLFEVAARRNLPFVLFAEGGGGRPGDTDHPGASWLDCMAFTLFARLAHRVQTIGVTGGYCFAGNAALLGTCGTVVALQGSSIGMGGPAMIAGGGLGDVAPGDVGPVEVHERAGQVDLVVGDDAAAVGAVRRLLADTAPPPAPLLAGDDDLRPALRDVLPESRRRAYDPRVVLDEVLDAGSLLELQPRFGRPLLVGTARLGGRPVGVVASQTKFNGGAVDRDAAVKAAGFLDRCSRYALPVLTFVDTPGFMVGPAAEGGGQLRPFGRLFSASASLTAPLLAVVLRKAYGLGAQALTGGSLHSADLTLAWPTAELGAMNLEGAVELGFRAELGALPDDERPAARENLVRAAYELGSALSVAEVFELDDVIDPATTRQVLLAALTALAQNG